MHVKDRVNRTRHIHAFVLSELDRHGKTTPELFEKINFRLAQSVTARNALGSCLIDPVFIWKNFGNNPVFHPVRSQWTNSTNAVTDLERRHNGTSYTGRHSSKIVC